VCRCLCLMMRFPRMCLADPRPLRRLPRFASRPALREGAQTIIVILVNTTTTIMRDRRRQASRAEMRGASAAAMSNSLRSPGGGERRYARRDPARDAGRFTDAGAKPSSEGAKAEPAPTGTSPEVAKPVGDPATNPVCWPAHLMRCAGRPAPKRDGPVAHNVAGSISLSIEGSGSSWILASNARKRL
jgi:hypothetical protein